jgi:uncharacterized protein (TIGR00369 family)
MDAAEPAPWMTADDLNANQGALGEKMGIHFTEVGVEQTVATMPVAGNTQPYGILHGGASVVLAESIGSMMAVLVAGPGRAAVGMTITAVHHRPASSGSVTGVGTVLAVGRTTATIAIAVSDDAGRRVCSCTLLCQLRDAPPQQA